jgi:hypothetical protein
MFPGSFMGQQHLHASILSLDAFTGEKQWSASFRKAMEHHGAARSMVIPGS